jgi:hypothetical protein
MRGGLAADSLDRFRLREAVGSGAMGSLSATVSPVRRSIARWARAASRRRRRGARRVGVESKRGAGDVHRRQIERLRRLGVDFHALSAAQKLATFRRFADAFVDPARREEFMAAVARPRPIDYDRFVPPERVRSVPPAEGSLRWLAGGAGDARCLRMERRASLPALDILIASLDEVWATSWPGMLVSFPAGRALVVTLDYERIHCDVRSPAPYR